MWAGCRIFVSLNFWVSVQMFTLSLSWRRLREEVFMDLGQSEISDKGQSRTFWSLRSRLWEIICRILLEAALAVLINIHSPTQCFYTLNRKSPVKMNRRDVGKAQWDHTCAGWFGKGRKPEWVEEQLGCDAVSVTPSPNPMGRTEPGVAPKSTSYWIQTDHRLRGISWGGMTAEGCLLAALSVAEEVSPSVLKGNLCHYHSTHYSLFRFPLWSISSYKFWEQLPYEPLFVGKLEEKG